MKMLILILVLLISAVFSNAQSINKKEYSLVQTFEEYVETYLERDVASLKTYFTKNDNLPFITSNGYKTTTMDQYINGLVSWFSDTTWTYESMGREYTKYDNVGIVIDNAHFHMADGTTYKMYVTYVFRKEEGMWRMVADVCTAIQ